MTALVHNFDFVEFQAATGIIFNTPVALGTGEVKGIVKNANSPVTYTHTGKSGGYSLIVKEVRDANGYGRYHMMIRGSLHKNHFNGRNSERFSFDMLSAEIAHLCRSLNLKPESCNLRNIEIGLNLPLYFPVFPFIQNNVLMHSTNPFEYYKRDSRGKVIGKYATHHQYVVKLYDKGLQYDIVDNLLRFELRYKKMQIPNKYGIKTLADLTDINKMRDFSKLLLMACDRLLIGNTDIQIDDIKLSPSQRQLILEGRNRDYWTRLHATNSKSFDRQRRNFRKLVKEHSGMDKHALIRERIRQELDLIFQRAFLPHVMVQDFKPGKSILTTWIKSHSSPTSCEDMSYTRQISQPIQQPNNPEQPDLYIPYEATHDKPVQQSDSPDAPMPSTLECINPSDSTDKSDTMKQPMHSETTKTGEHPLGHQTTDEYDGTQANGTGSPEAAIQVESIYPNNLDWITARFLNKL